MTELQVAHGAAPGHTACAAAAVLSDAIVVPERPHDRPLACGVLTRDLSFVEASRCHVRPRRTTTAPALARDEPVDRLEGTYLYGGHLREHFGHFLLESLGRLWACEGVGRRPDGVAYMPFRGKARAARRALEGYGALLGRLVPDTPITIITRPTSVARLFVPDMGFGWNELFAGTPEFRSLVKRRLSTEAMPVGGPRLYISRARLRDVKGGVLGEAALEVAMARTGYDVFHPECHDIDTQLSRYAAAREIVALDGSALHLAAFVLRQDARVAMILRRSNANHADYSRQFRAFAGIDIDVIDALAADWTKPDATRAGFGSMGELDFDKLFNTLAVLGYIAASDVGPPPDLKSPGGMVRRPVGRCEERSP